MKLPPPSIAPCGCLVEFETLPGGDTLVRIVSANDRCNHVAEILTYADEHDIPAEVSALS